MKLELTATEAILIMGIVADEHYRCTAYAPINRNQKRVNSLESVRGRIARNLYKAGFIDETTFNVYKSN